MKHADRLERLEAGTATSYVLRTVVKHADRLREVGGRDISLMF